MTDLGPLDLHWRLEPRQPHGDLQRGFAAELADPLWFLARQWQLGEHQGENASSPVEVTVELALTPIGEAADRPGQDPRIVPAEAIVEGEPDDWWTVGRRIRIGLAAVAQGVAPVIDAGLPPAFRDCVFRDVPAPYTHLAGEVYDGLELSRHHAAALGDLLDEVPRVPRPSHWLPDSLVHRTAFPCGDTSLTVARHDGGDVDWWSVDADRPLTPAPPEPPDARTIVPDRFRYPGAPHPRWWQIEDAHVDIGGFPPDRGHLATLLLIDLIAGHSDDWFTFPVPALAGHVLTVLDMRVTDSFGDPWPAPPAPGDWPPADDWSLFTVRDLDPPAVAPGLPATRSLPIWPTAATPLPGERVEDVTLGVDEDANLVWAVEERLGGVRTDYGRPAATWVVEGSGVDPTEPRFRYRPSTDVPEHWHPYLLPATGRRPFRQATLVRYPADGSPPPPPPPLPPSSEPPKALLLTLPDGAVHELEPAAIPRTGLRLERRWMLARATDGAPVLWMQRRRLPLLGPPSSQLRWDVAEPETVVDGPP